MVINENNSYINTFTAGMNSDSAYDQLDNKHYVYGKNIRITKNQQLGGYNDYATQHEGIVTPVLNGIYAGSIDIEGNIGDILAVDSVDRLCTIVTNNHNSLQVYRVFINEEGGTVGNTTPLWESEDFWEDGEEVPSKLSTVLYKELENVIKLYIATGKTPLIVLRVDEETNLQWHTPIDCVINNRIVPENRVYIDEVISGRLKTQQVQYTYRLYNKYANTTQLAPLTNKIQVIDGSRSKENGNAEDTETSLGFKLIIKKDDKYWDYFQYIQVYRLSYIKQGEPAEVSLIYDDKRPNGSLIVNDVGIEPLQTLTIEEFAAMSGLILVPQVVEQNQNYMFCGNVKDDTIIRDVTVTPRGDTAPYNLVCAKINLANDIHGRIPDHGTDSFVDTGDFNYTDYFKSKDVNPALAKANYENIFTSSLLRSLRRGEEYRYGIVFYDKYGRRTDVTKIADVTVPEPEFYGGSQATKKIFDIDGDEHLFANSVGVKFKIPKVKGASAKDIIGCQILRRSSSEIYQKTLLQVALARPISQGLAITNGDVDKSTPTKYSPYYPSGFLNVNNLCIYPSYYQVDSFRPGDPIWNILDLMVHRMNQIVVSPGDYSSIDELLASLSSREELFAIPTLYWATTKNNQLFQIFSSEIDYRRDDVLNKLNVSNMNISEIAFLPSEYKLYGAAEEKVPFYGLSSSNDKFIKIDRYAVQKLNQNEKVDQYWVFNYFKILTNGFYKSFFNVGSDNKVKSVKDVKIPNWEDGFTNVQRREDQNIYTAIKKYKQFVTGIDQYTYNNWCSFGKYDLKAGAESQTNVQDDLAAAEMIGTNEDFATWKNEDDARCRPRMGYIGAGGSCLLLTTEQNKENGDKPVFSLNTPLDVSAMMTDRFWTSICNITHNPKLDNVEGEESTLYYGFGNYFPLEYKNEDLYIKGTNNQTLTVFDGDIYITPHEFTTMYKTFNFESIDTLQSTQITNYVPLESKVNTYFDYGMNLRNTNSANLLNEPGNVDGVTGQDRPAHQYNMIYSDNDVSSDVFTLISTDKNETNQFKQRAYFSEPKTNGEFIDNFPIFKAASFIDVDSQYGQLTNMDTDKNNLYYWQDHAFGKFSVNERSLINDTNGNTIMLGQAGIISRYDYLSTKFGMRLYDFCSRTTENGLFWVDINNKAVVGSVQNGVVNYGEQLFVQNLINNSISNDVPYVDYDIQNNELLCKCLNDGEQIVFNTKYNIATSIYNRKYDNIAYIKNHLFGIYNKNVYKFNYIKNQKQPTFLTPIALHFVVNPNTSITKVFDSQQIVPIKRNTYLPDIVNNTNMKFETDLYNATWADMNEVYTDREGNIIYNIPRFEQEAYGNRLRGKWMKVEMTNDNQSQYNQSQYTSISHVITKFRQSFS